MSKKIKQIAKEYLEAGLSVLFLKPDKRPNLSEWETLQKKPLNIEEVETLFNGKSIRLEIETPRKNKKTGEEFIVKGIKFYPERDPSSVGIITGAISGGLEVIDVDTKHDTTGTLWEELNGLLQDNLSEETYNKLVIAQTKSGGYHIYYRCSSIAGNLKLSFKENKEVLVETRGEGGYVVAPPTTGYKYIQGNPTNIATITPETRDLILTIGRSFNEIEEEVKPKKETSAKKQEFDNSTGLSPMEDYNNRGDVVSLLQSYGWKVVSTRGARVNVLRPGETESKTSGNFHTGLRTLRIFSSSTDFDTAKAYNPYQVFELLEAKGDYKEAYKKLLKLGYGESYKLEDNKPTQIDNKAIDVTIVNPVNRETSFISKAGNSLKIEELETAIGEEAIITITKEGATDEVLKNIALLQRLGKRIYIKEGETEEREYTYQLGQIFKKYGAIEEANGELSARDIDSLLDEVIIVSSKLQPIDKDIFLKEFLDLENIKELGISEESLSITVDRLTTTTDKETQAIQFNKLLKKVQRLQDKGEIDKALEVLDTKVKEVKLKDKATEYSKILIPTSEAEIKEEEANLPDSLDTGFIIQGEELLLNGGAISVFSAPTNHGKTLLLINTVLNLAKKYPDKKFIFFTYEERSTAILQYFLNTYIDLDLNNSNKGNRRILRDYFKTGSTQYINSKNLEYFNSKKEEFFKEYIETGRIIVKYVDYNSEELSTGIEYLNKEDKTIGGIFVDYFQLLKLPKEKKSRQEELKQICIALKDTAVKTGLPLLLAAQFNREVTNLERLHPTNIGEAGDIERIVNTLIGLWNMDKKPVLKGITDAESKEIERKLFSKQISGEGAGNMYLEILKSRDLPTGSYDFLDFNGNTGKVKNKETPEAQTENVF